MDLEPSKSRKRKVSEPRVYAKGSIPYGVSRPKDFWRIKKDLPADQYWKKRYWRRRITGKGDYHCAPSRYGNGPTAHRLSFAGLGDYKVKKNVFLSGSLPVMTNRSSGGGTVIRFQEYLKDIVTDQNPNTFNLSSLLLNPGNTNTFPFLSQVANNYEQYELEGLVFEFRSTSADALNSTNTALGSVMMATQYDVADAPFSTKQEMLNYEFSTSVKPSASTLHMIECDPRQTSISELYVLDGDTAPPNTDARLYHLGRFSIATTGFQGASVNIGELHVTYQVRLLKPKLYTTLGSEIDYYHNTITGATVFSDTEPLGNAGALATASINTNIGVIVTPTSIQFPTTGTQRYYRFEISWIGDSKPYDPVDITPTSMLPVSPQRYAPALGVDSPSVTTTFSYVVLANALNPSLSFGATNLPAVGGFRDLRIVQINPANQG